jgi:hypothetical protein
MNIRARQPAPISANILTRETVTPSRHTGQMLLFRDRLA